MQRLNGQAPAPSLEQQALAFQQLQAVLMQRGIQDIQRFTDALVWVTNASLAGHPEAKAALDAYGRAHRQAVSGIVLPG